MKTATTLKFGDKAKGLEREKCCKDCRKVKPRAEFYEQGTPGKHYLMSYCIACFERRRGRWLKKHPDAPSRWQTHYRRRRFFGLEPEAYARLVDRQRGVCARCGKPPRHQALGVDYDRQRRRVRRLLCVACHGRLHAAPHAQEGGRLGGLALAAARTSAQRRAASRHAARVRWDRVACK